jgi:hypothetical protein
VGWLRRVGLRRLIVKELQFQRYILWRKRISIELQLRQIEIRSKFGSRQYVIKYTELVDICQELGRIEIDLRQMGWRFILTGNKSK